MQVTANFLNLTGKRALVCGASKGIGRAIAKMFAANGAEVVALARDASLLQSLVAELGPRAGFWVQDLTDLEGLKAELETRLARGQHFDILVNNTGGPKAGPLLNAGCEELEQAFHHHLLAAHALVTGVVPGMRERRFGRIINVISTSVKVPIPNLGVSNTVRAAMANWSKTLSIELGPYGITVNNILPGYIATERLATLKATISKQNGKTESEMEQEWLKAIPAGRFGQPEEAAFAALFFASPMAGYINGINMPVDGGRTGSL